MTKRETVRFEPAVQDIRVVESEVGWTVPSKSLEGMVGRDDWQEWCGSLKGK